jgi:hypothetical protein
MPKVYNCDDRTQIIIKPGKKSENDFIIFTNFPNRTHPHTLEYIGQALRLKSEVEEINYPLSDGYEGRFYLLRFVLECILNKKKSVKEICREFSIPTKLNVDQ